MKLSVDAVDIDSDEGRQWISDRYSPKDAILILTLREIACDLRRIADSLHTMAYPQFKLNFEPIDPTELRGR